MSEPVRRPLAAYLRARRQSLSPDDVGLTPTTSQRRVPGLRREEVALLAGISPDYYLRLEQGRERNPSAQVLDALARALRLEGVARDYLHALARDVAPSTASVHDEGLGASWQWLLDSWPQTPAFIHNRYFDVLASNRVARAFNPLLRPGLNAITGLFTEPAARELYQDWDVATEDAVSALRALVGVHLLDGHVRDMLAELDSRSERFRELWGRSDVGLFVQGVHQIRHPEVGHFTVQFARFPMDATNGLGLFVYHAEPGTPSAEALHRLAARAATDPTDPGT